MASSAVYTGDESPQGRAGIIKPYRNSGRQFLPADGGNQNPHGACCRLAAGSSRSLNGKECLSMLPCQSRCPQYYEGCHKTCAAWKKYRAASAEDSAAAVPILTITAGSVPMWSAGAGRWTLTGLCGSGPWILNRGGFSHGTSPGTFLCGTGRRRLAGPGAPLPPALALTGCFPPNRTCSLSTPARAFFSVRIG